MTSRKSITRGTSIFLLTLSLASAFAAPSASAAQTGTGTPSYTQSELEDDGYSCETVSLGFIECTKGDVTYWCSAGSCTLKPRRVGTHRVELPTSAGTVMTGEYTPISITVARPKLSLGLLSFSLAR